MTEERGRDTERERKRGRERGRESERSKYNEKRERQPADPASINMTGNESSEEL